MKINVKDLTYFEIQERAGWLDKNAGQRQYWLHNKLGGVGWRYFPQDRTIIVDDEKLALMFVLTFGA